MSGRKGARHVFDPEHELQAALVAWIRIQQEPEWDLLFSIPNGGKRNPIVAVKMAAEGSKPGVSDLFWSIARAGYHGLYLETKVDLRLPRNGKLVRYKTDLSRDQQEFKRRVEAEGYCHRTFWSLAQGQVMLWQYLTGNNPMQEVSGGEWPYIESPEEWIRTFQRQHRREKRHG
jgi:hypothetical protein